MPNFKIMFELITELNGKVNAEGEEVDSNIYSSQQINGQVYLNEYLKRTET